MRARSARDRRLHPAARAGRERNAGDELNFPVNLIVRTIPEPPDPWACPQPGTPEHGKYLTNIAGCRECHTPHEQGQIVEGLDFAGGWAMPLPSGGTVTSANITPHPETGIGEWTKEQFVAKFKAYSHPGAAAPVS